MFRFQVRKGEIIGVAGLMGAGRTEIMQAIFGYEPFEFRKNFNEWKRSKN